MANPQNLKPWKERTSSERREIMKKAGIASGKKRRETKAARDYLMLIHSTPMNATQKKKSKCLGEVDEADLNQYLAEVLELHRQALKGNVKAMELIFKMRGHMPADKFETVNQNYNLPTGITITYVDSDEPEHTDSASV